MTESGSHDGPRSYPERAAWYLQAALRGQGIWHAVHDRAGFWRSSGLLLRLAAHCHAVPAVAVFRHHQPVADAGPAAEVWRTDIWHPGGGGRGGGGSYAIKCFMQAATTSSADRSSGTGTRF